MCGIVYVKRKDNRPAYKSVLKRYRNQKGRGTEGFGYVAIHNGAVVSYKRSATEKEIIKAIEKETAEEILFHHRMPTSTPNVEEAAHPILVESNYLKHQFFVAHNGVIRNDDELKAQHNQLGIKYSTELINGFISAQTKKYYRLEGPVEFNDSESLAVEVALAIEEKKDKIDTEGSAAVMGIETDHDRVINRFFFRNTGNPLYFHEDDMMVTVLSTGSGVMVLAGDVYKLKEKTGGYEEYRKGLSAPTTYKPWVAPNNTDRFLNRDTMEWEAGSHRRTIELPAATRTSFHGALDEEMGLNWDNRDPDARTIKEVLADIDKYQMRGHALPISAMTLDVLWSEYDKNIGYEEILKGEVDKLDIEWESGRVHGGLFKELEVAQEKLAKIRQYLDDLSNEVTKRESSGARAIRP